MAGKQRGFWDAEERLRELSAQGDPLEKLAATVDFEMFRTDLTAALGLRDPAGFAPENWITDKLPSYGAALRHGRPCTNIRTGPAVGG